MSIPELARAVGRVLEGHGGVRVALLFGSQARGKARVDSDVDLAIDSSGADLLELASALTLALGREVDLVALDDAGVPLLEELLRDAVVVYEAFPGAAASWRARALTTLETDRPWFARMRDAWLRRLASQGQGI